MRTEWRLTDVRVDLGDETTTWTGGNVQTAAPVLCTCEGTPELQVRESMEHISCHMGAPLKIWGSPVGRAEGARYSVGERGSVVEYGMRSASPIAGVRI